MLKCTRVDRVPDDIMVTYIKYHTLAGLRMKMELEFDEVCDWLEDGQIYMVAKIPDDCSDDVSFADLASAGVNIVAYCYEPEPYINHRIDRYMTEEQIINEIRPKAIKEIKEPLTPMIATKEDIERAKKLDEEYYSKNNR